MAEQLLKVTIDNITIEVPAGTTILEAARKIGGNAAPPAMCYYSKLKGSGGKCRACLVEVSKGSDKDPRPMPKLVPSCRTAVMDGMEVKNNTSPKVQDTRAAVVEFLLLNHPLDCPICDQAGECHLQDLSYNYGKAASRYDFQKRTFEKRDLGDRIQLRATRCILCYRCVMAAEQLTKTRQHGVIERGSHAQIASFLNQCLDNQFIGNIIDVCPVGALTDKTFRFKNRVWFLKPLLAHRDCPNCCGKVTLWNRGDEVFRVTARKDEWGEVEDWICDECRFEKKQTGDWIIEGEPKIDRHSVISINKYPDEKMPKDTLEEIIGKEPRLLFNIHDVSQVNKQDRDLSEIQGAAHSTDF